MGFVKIVPVRRKRVVLEGVGGSTTLGSSADNATAAQAAVIVRAASLAVKAMPRVDPSAKSLLIICNVVTSAYDALRKNASSLVDAFTAEGFRRAFIPGVGNEDGGFADALGHLDEIIPSVRLFQRALTNFTGKVGNVGPQMEFLTQALDEEVVLLDNMIDDTILGSVIDFIVELPEKVIEVAQNAAQAAADAAHGAASFIDTLATIAIVGFGAYIFSMVAQKPSRRARRNPYRRRYR